jgi:hypothetical protein
VLLISRVSSLDASRTHHPSLPAHPPPLHCICHRQCSEEHMARLSRRAYAAFPYALPQLLHAALVRISTDILSHQITTPRDYRYNVSRQLLLPRLHPESFRYVLGPSHRCSCETFANNLAVCSTPTCLQRNADRSSSSLLSKIYE